MKVLGAAGSLILALAFGCAAPREATDDVASAQTDSPLGEAKPLWDAYTAEVTANPLQEGCKPFVAAPRTGTYVGVALLLHGYSACPQQYEELVPKLTAAGFLVLSALLPGHGRVPIANTNGRFVDVGPDVPDEAHRSEYAAFAKRMALLVSAAPAGKHVVAGLSLGATIAVSAVDQAPGLFYRSLLLNPFFDASQPLTWAIPTASLVAGKARMSFPGCEKDRAAGRAGFCNFDVSQLRAVQRFGNEMLARTGSIDTETHIVGIEDDGAASPKASAAAATNMQNAVACFFEKKIPHSMLSRKENPSTEKYWMPALLAQANRYMVTGQPFDTTGPSSIRSFPRCRTR